MFKGFDWHHWLLLAVGLAVTAGPDVASVLGNDGLTGAAGTVTRAVAFLTVVAAMLKESPLAGDRPKPPDPGALARGLVVLVGLGLALRAMTACSPAQVRKVESGFQADGTLVGCVIAAAVSTGGNVAAIAGICSADEIQVAEILWDAITMPPGAAASSRSARVAQTNAAVEVIASWGPRVLAAKSARASASPGL